MPEAMVELRAGRAQDLPTGQRKLVFRENAESILLLNIDGAYFALENNCPHAGASIASGVCEGQRLSCPAHGLTFDVATGQCVASPGMRIETFDVEVRHGELIVKTGDGGACRHPPKG